MNTLLKIILQLRSKKYIPKKLQGSEDYIDLALYEIQGGKKEFVYRWFVNDDYIYQQLRMYEKEDKKNKPNKSDYFALKVIDCVRETWGENATVEAAGTQGKYGRSLIVVRVDVNQTRYRVVG